MVTKNIREPITQAAVGDNDGLYRVCSPQRCSYSDLFVGLR
ncbi:MAG TPA: hypothetical protein VK993_15030 [Chthoniobacterales bacterium]|nr:hypothetical protein [Chthoniobacterales bacterium]